ncbi:hypothetical protein D3227_40735 [Mesorhizobium waimense]|uniref:Uncharacterized protein n=1 Tax=Mesorhizobium waimense TaxID=1300307 RepID=A0A3A5JIT3_9HYPH|nr:hypothetical protein D3227_40735 [Mesorhizobium waimense]
MPMPFAVWNSIAAVAEFVPGALIQRNQVDLMRVDNVAAIDLPGLRQVGIEPRDILEVIGMIEHTGD